jgi:1,4-dihydroxy-2-naphthoate octaprenyltransferase
MTAIALFHSNPERLTAFTSVGIVPLLALAVLTSLFLQLSVNWANDYFDDKKGNSSTLRPKTELRTSKKRFLFGVTLSAVFGLTLIFLSPVSFAIKLVLVFFGVLAILAVVFYSGGKKSYADLGLAILVAFFFFGPVATYGTFVLLNGDLALSLDPILKSISFGLLVGNQLLLDDIRDIPQDRKFDKRTLAVRIGQKKSIILYCVILILALLLSVLTIKAYLICIALALFLFVASVYQFVNLKLNDLEHGEVDFIKSFQFNSAIGVALGVLLIF